MSKAGRISRTGAQGREGGAGPAAEDAPKLGLFTGRHAVNPINGEAVPILVSNYVVMEQARGRSWGARP